MFSRIPFPLWFGVHCCQEKYACNLEGKSEAIAILPWRSVKSTRCCCRLLPLLLICWLWGIAASSSQVPGDSSSHLISFISFSKFWPDGCAGSWCRSPAASIGQQHCCSWRQWETDMEFSLCLMVLVCSHEFQFALDLPLYAHIFLPYFYADFWHLQVYYQMERQQSSIYFFNIPHNCTYMMLMHILLFWKAVMLTTIPSMLKYLILYHWMLQ